MRPTTTRHRVTILGLLCGFALIISAGAPATAAEPGFQLRERDPASSAATIARLAAMTPEDAAQRRIWVYFTDKEIFDSATCALRLQEVTATIGEHAAARRAKVLGPDLADFHDIPVATAYLAALRAHGAEIGWPSRWLNAVSVRAPLAVMEQISRLAFVQKITLVARGRANHPRYGAHRPSGEERDPLDYGPSFGQLDEIAVTDAHAAGYSGAGVIVCMLDTGFNQDHPAFTELLADGRLLAQYDFINDDDNTQNEGDDPENQEAHGTLTWSIVGGFDEGELIGGAYGASFLLAKTEDISQEVPQEEDDWVAGAEWADALGADVFSSSLAYKDWYTYEDMDGNTAVTTIAADIAVGRGIVVCNSAGNYGTQDWYYIAAPADGDSVIAVGAMRPDGDMASFSSHGPTYDGRIKPEVIARGEDTVGAVRPNTIPGHPEALYWPLSGTSVAAPLVASAAALVLEAHPDWTPMMVRQALMLTADNADTPDNWRGWGLIDVMAAIGAPVAAPESIGVQALRLSAWPNPAGDTVQFGLRLPAAAATEEAVLELYSLDGRRLRTLRGQPGEVQLRWDGRDGAGRKLPAGTYLARLRAGAWQATGKVVLKR